MPRFWGLACFCVMVLTRIPTRGNPLPLIVGWLNRKGGEYTAWYFKPVIHFAFGLQDIEKVYQALQY